jgi:hypothetical protein
MDTSITRRWDDAAVWIASVLLLASVAVNLVQSHRISSLRSRLEGLASERDLRVGSKVPDIIGLTPEGRTQTPETIVISPDNKVVRVWHGAYETAVRQEIEKFLQVRLPGRCAGN